MNREELNEAMTALAQGVININEGHASIEEGSRIYRAMAALVEAHVNGSIAADGVRDAVGHLCDARVSLDAASSSICAVKGKAVAAIWRRLGRLTSAVIKERDALDAELHALRTEDVNPNDDESARRDRGLPARDGTS